MKEKPHGVSIPQKAWSHHFWNSTLVPRNNKNRNIFCRIFVFYFFRDMYFTFYRDGLGMYPILCISVALRTQKIYLGLLEHWQTLNYLWIVRKCLRLITNSWSVLVLGNVWREGRFELIQIYLERNMTQTVSINIQHSTYS